LAPSFPTASEKLTSAVVDEGQLFSRGGGGRRTVGEVGAVELLKVKDGT